MIYQRQRARLFLGGLFICVVAIGLGLLMSPPAARAACAALPAAKGTVTSSVNFTTAGTYRVWVRMLAPSSAASGVYLQVADAGACQVTVGRVALPANQLTWVDYQDGNVASKISVSVPAGTHQVVLAGLDDGVEVDRVLFLSDAACTPTGDGSNCTVAATPTPTVTLTPTPTPTPTPPVGDTQPPTVPAGLHSTGQTDASVALAWNGSTDNVGVAGYRVKRNGVQVATTASTNYVDSGLAPSTAYSYTLSAYDAAGNQSANSPALIASTGQPLDTIQPTAPLNVAAQANSPTSVAVTWAAATDNVGVTGYYVLRGGVTLAFVTGTGYIDATATAGTAYSYVVKARDAAGNVGPASNTATVTTPNPPDTQVPSAPTGLVAMAVTAGQVNLSWTGATDNVGVVGYRLSRNGQFLAQVSGTGYGDATAAPSTAYSYTVTAFDAAGNVSTASNTVSVTTPPADTVVAGGLNATYFDGEFFDGTTVSRVDPVVNFNWVNGSPASSISPDTFSARWAGTIYAPSTGTYTFYTRSDDGVRLWVNGKRVINNWTLHSARENKGSITLSGGQQYDIKLEFFENTGQAVAALLWKGPGIGKQVIPRNVLYHR